MVAVNLNEGQKPCELGDAYPAILHDSSLCGQEGSAGEVEADFCLCSPVPEYGEVPDYTTNGLNNRAQVFGWAGMEEGDGLADNDASEGNGESEGAGEGKDASDSHDVNADADVSVDTEANAVGVDAGRDVNVDISFGDCSANFGDRGDSSGGGGSSANDK